MPYATPSDVAARLGRELTEQETSLVSTRLEDAERMILRKIPDLADKISAGDIDVADVKQVEAEAVLRLVRNPEGYASEQDGTYGYTFSRDLASGKLEITREEWEMLGLRTGRVLQLVPNVARCAQ
ncbi:Gp19/Gp15/Gp42 family protein [Mycolicibacterium smegmatis]|uniref:Gp19/Gp15/Gp42 family protein n=1 Tax=Mycolicibacterium smegmatis TaxID=1772 RepID=UPI001303066E|nr:Gp19/Gp15/Gp42 family protein [Mycolicibacterium smegmatis]